MSSQCHHLYKNTSPLSPCEVHYPVKSSQCQHNVIIYTRTHPNKPLRSSRVANKIMREQSRRSWHRWTEERYESFKKLNSAIIRNPSILITKMNKCKSQSQVYKSTFARRDGVRVCLHACPFSVVWSDKVFNDDKNLYRTFYTIICALSW